MSRTIMNRFTLAAIILFGCIAFINSNAKEVKPISKPDYSREDDPDYKKQRQQWIDDMHRCDSGVNYRIIDRENQKAAIKARLDKMNDKSPTLQSIQDPIGSIKLTGIWTERGSNNQAGRVHVSDIDFDRNLIYLGSSGGNIWRGPIEGNNWTCLNNSLQFKDIRSIKLFKINNTNRIVSFNGECSIYYSDNEGSVWTKAIGLESADNNGWLKSIAIRNNSDQHAYVLLRQWNSELWQNITTLYKSTDHCTSFTQVSSWETDVDMCDIWAPRYDSKDVFLVRRDSLFKITADDQIVYLSNFTADINLSDYEKIYMKGSAVGGIPNIALSLKKRDYPNQDFLVYSFTQDSWANTGTIGKAMFFSNSFEVSQTDPQLFYYGEVNCYYSTDQGGYWQQVNDWTEYYQNPENTLHADVPSITSYKNTNSQEIIIVTTDGGIYISYDKLQTVKNLSMKSLNVSQYYSTYTHRKKTEKAFAGAQDQGFQYCKTSSDTTLAFEQKNSGDFGHLSSSNDGDRVWFVYPGSAWQFNSTAPSTESDLIAMEFTGTNGLWMPPILAIPGYPKEAYLAQGGNAEKYAMLWKLTIDNDHFRLDSLDFDFSQGDSWQKISAIEVSPNSKRKIYILTNNGRFFKSIDEGLNWTKNEEFVGPESHYFYGSSIKASKKTDGLLYIAGSGYSNGAAYMSNDEGDTFTSISDGLPHTLIYEIALTDDEEMLFAATEAGPYVYIVRDNRWYPLVQDNTPQQTYWSVDYVPALKTARFGTYGRGIWDYKITSYNKVEDKPATSVTQNAKIDIYPNPVISKSSTGSLNINVNLAKTASGTLSLFDYNGRLIKELFSGTALIGCSSFSWNLKNANNESLLAGNYLCVWNSTSGCAFAKVIVE